MFELHRLSYIVFPAYYGSISGKGIGTFFLHLSNWLVTILSFNSIYFSSDETNWSKRNVIILALQGVSFKKQNYSLSLR